MKNDLVSPRVRAPLFVSVSLACAAASLSGCMSSPTYGTDKTANQQLVEDLSGVLSIGGSKRQAEIAYTPRPELVTPPSLEVLPPPQEDVASSTNPAWPESPEQRRQRVRADATQNQNNPLYRAPVTAEPMDTAPAKLPWEDRLNSHYKPSDRAEVNRRLRERTQGDPNTRKYLSEPPVDYRVPAASAPTGDVGEPEWRKERQARRAAGGGKSWRDFIPGL